MDLTGREALGILLIAGPLAVAAAWLLLTEPAWAPSWLDDLAWPVLFLAGAPTFAVLALIAFVTVAVLFELAGMTLRLLVRVLSLGRVRPR